MKEKQTPKIVRRGAQWFVMTRYHQRDGIDPMTQSQVPYLVATTEFEITDQMNAILKYLAAEKASSEPRLRLEPAG